MRVDGRTKVGVGASAAVRRSRVSNRISNRGTDWLHIPALPLCPPSLVRGCEQERKQVVSLLGPRKLGAPPPPAGYGLKAVTGGTGPEHDGGRALYEECGQINARSSEHPHVLTTTSNLAELVAFTRAVDWAHANRLAFGKPVCIRYDSMYAAHIATGIWKAKKHKPMARAARQAWARLKRSKEGRAWMKHVRGHTGNQWNERADRLADQGRGGKSVKRYFDG